MLKLKPSKHNVITEDFDFIKKTNSENQEQYDQQALFSFTTWLNDSLEQSFILTSLGIICSLVCVWFFSTYLYYSIG